MSRLELKKPSSEEERTLTPEERKEVNRTRRETEVSDDFDEKVELTNNRRYTLEDLELEAFYMMPKFLFWGSIGTGLSSDAKILYTLLRDRYSLSKKNGWINEKNEVYFIFTRSEMEYMLGKSKNTVIKAVNALKEFNLLDEITMGMNKPNMLYLKYPSKTYVNKYLKKEEKILLEEHKRKISERAESEKIYKENSRKRRKLAIQKGLEVLEQEEGNSGSSKNELPEVQNVNIHGGSENELPGRSKVELPGGVKSELPEVQELVRPEVQKVNPNNTDYNYTYSSDNDSSNNDLENNTDLFSTQSFNQSHTTYMGREPNKTEIESIDRWIRNKYNNNYSLISMEDIDKLEEEIKEQIGYETLIDPSYKNDKGLIDNIVNVIQNVILTPDGKVFNIKGMERSTAMVKKVFYKLDFENIEYALWTFSENTTKITDIYSYLVAVLFMAPQTQESWYSARVKSDMREQYDK